VNNCEIKHIEINKKEKKKKNFKSISMKIIYMMKKVFLQMLFEIPN